MSDRVDACREWIEGALAYGGGTHTFEDVKRMIFSGKAQLWQGETGCAVTEVIVYPRKRVLHCFLAGGEMEQIIDMIDSAVAWGKTQGCTGLTLSGRMGWQRVLAKHGFKPVLMTLERPF